MTIETANQIRDHQVRERLPSLLTSQRQKSDIGKQFPPAAKGRALKRLCPFGGNAQIEVSRLCSQCVPSLLSPKHTVFPSSVEEHIKLNQNKVMKASVLLKASCARSYHTGWCQWSQCNSSTASDTDSLFYLCDACQRVCSDRANSSTMTWTENQTTSSPTIALCHLSDEGQPTSPVTSAVSWF